MADARFEEGAEQALTLKAETPDDLAILSALVQDAVLPAGEIRHDPRGRTLSLLLNRFRWEDQTAAEATRRPYERVRALLVIADVTSLASLGFDRMDKEVILSVLSLSWQPAVDCTGELTLTLAGDGAIAVRVECLNVTLKDVTRPYLAPSRQMPHHPD